MIYLLVYDRAKGILRSEQSFKDSDLAHANEARLHTELENANAPDVEVVILQSGSKRELRATHARYFKTVRQLSKTS